MAKRQQPWWWRSEALGQVAGALFAALVAAYLARLLMLYLPWSRLSAAGDGPVIANIICLSSLMRLWLTAIAFAWAATAYSQPAALMTGNDLRQLCATNPQECRSYIATVAELLHPSDCRAYATADIDAVAVTLSYLRDGGDLGDFDAVLIIKAAIEEAAGCAGRGWLG
jgi:hypothetical protein